VQAVFDILCSLLAALAAAAFAQFGVTLEAKDVHHKPQPEVRRTTHAEAVAKPKPYVTAPRKASPVAFAQSGVTPEAKEAHHMLRSEARRAAHAEAVAKPKPYVTVARKASPSSPEKGA